MTATPIPRTVAMTVFGDLEVSTLTELPAGRQPIATHVVPVAEKPRYLDRAWQRVTEEVASGRQAYIVCPRIGGDGPGDGPGESDSPSGTDNDDAELRDGDLPDGEQRRPPISVIDLAAQLDAGPLAGLRTAVLHGRLPSEEKDKIMLSFADSSVDVLITTTVVEVGVDVPNATAMVIMDAERFGVSQLHQLRGRVGRGSHEGLCLLVTEVPEGSQSRERLDAVAATLDGFSLSRLDLEQRREGDVLGAAQAGRKSSLKLLTLLADEDLIGSARQEATALVSADPALAGHAALAAAVSSLVDQEQAEFLEKA
jgi:ATP-dependent DNA helicase RecG